MLLGRVRQAVPGDQSALRAVRLRALSDTPDAFGSTYAREVARTPADWERWLAPGATFLLEDSAGPKGLVAGLRDEADRTLVHLVSMWVDPELRGTGAAGELVHALLSWARSVAADEVRLLVIESNGRARRFYERLGFRLTGRETVRERDGAVELEMRAPVG